MAGRRTQRRRRTLAEHVQRARRICQRDRTGRILLFAVWLGLAAASNGVSVLQFTTAMDRRELF